MTRQERIDKILTRIRQIAPDPLPRDKTVLDQSPAVKVINSVLSLRRPYTTVVKKRLDAFQKKNPDVIQVSDLVNLMARYDSPYDFLKAELDFHSELKATAIDDVVVKLYGIIDASPSVPEEDAIRQWALQAKPKEYRVWNITNFKLAGFQWLRMLFGADTAKPDTHILNFLADTLNEEFPQTSYKKKLEAVDLIEEASAHSEFSARDIDRIIWGHYANPSPVCTATDGY